MKYTKDNKYLVVGLSGYAGSGKDLFCEKLCKRMPFMRKYALADALKDDVRTELFNEYKIDILRCTREEKQRVRHVLVNYGTRKREETDGRHWIDKINDLILPLRTDICVTDIRYAEHEMDEHDWIKQQLCGVLVWIDQFTVNVEEGAKIFNKAPNKEEEKNGPLLKQHADYVVEWEKVKNKDELDCHVNKFIEWLNEKESRGHNPSLQS